MGKHHGKRYGKHQGNHHNNHAETKRGNGEVLTILRVFNLHQNFKNLDILYLNAFKIINRELLQV